MFHSLFNHLKYTLPHTWRISYNNTDIKKKEDSHIYLYMKKMDDTGIEPGTSHMLSECDNQLHQTP